jgi:hypothetical protein
MAMAFRQYTSCIKPQYFDGTFAGNEGLIVAAVVGAIYALSLVIGLFVPATIYIAIAALIYLITYLNWWLYGRLICLKDEDECIIGAALGAASSNPRKKGGDDDASFNVVLAPSTVDMFASEDPGSADKFAKRLPEPKEHYWSNPLQGHIVEPNDDVLTIGRGYVSDAGHARYLKAIHCEFEGSGIRNLMAWAGAVLAVLIAALLASSIPGLGTFLAWIAIILTLFFGVTAVTDPLNPGDPQDVGINRGELVAGAIVVLKGNWVYDSLHNGWNEIHAIHAGQIIGEMAIDPVTDKTVWPAEIDTPPEFTDKLGLDTIEKVERAIGVWCLAIKQAEDAEGGGSHDDPAQNWVVHPLIDGCKKVIIL